MVTVCDVETVGLVDSGPMVTSVSEEFYRSVIPRSEFHEDFQLSLHGPDSRTLKYFCVIIMKTELSFIANPICMPALVVPTTEYNLKVPIIVGTKRSSDAKQQAHSTSSREIAFLNLQNGFIGNVKSTNKIDIEIKPYETVIVSGLLKKNQAVEDDVAVSENSEKGLK